MEEHRSRERASREAKAQSPINSLIFGAATSLPQTCLTAEGPFYYPQGSFSFTPLSDGNFGRPPYLTTHSNELQAAAHLQQSPIRPTYTPEAYCYTILRRVLHRPKGEERSPGLQPLERIRNEIALKGRPVRHEALIIAQVKVLHC